MSWIVAICAVFFPGTAFVRPCFRLELRVLSLGLDPMKNTVIPFPLAPSEAAPDLKPGNSGDEVTRAALRDMREAIAEEPTPERLRVLAEELGRVLDARANTPRDPEK